MEIMMKKFIAIILLTFASTALSAAPSGSAQNYLKEKHLKSYITQCIEYWFYPEHNSPELKMLAKAVRKTIEATNGDSYQWNWNSLAYEALYTREYVEQLLRGAIIEHLTEKSRSVALSFTSKAWAHHIADRINQELINLCFQSIELKQGIFSGYTGASLRNHVIEWYDYLQQQSYAPVTVYPSTECCICYESFYDAARVFLVPCGHDICVNCAERWFFTQHKTSCPQCRQTVDKHALQATINHLVY